MGNPYKQTVARPVSFSLKPKHLKKIDERRGVASRSQYIQHIIEQDGDHFTVSEAKTKQLIAALMQRDDLPPQISIALLKSAFEVME